MAFVSLLSVKKPRAIACSLMELKLAAMVRLDQQMMRRPRLLWMLEDSMDRGWRKVVNMHS